ncbi:alpha-E domain-containing protein [Sulfuriferula sp.]|uniref:alpha-E domain-containing protein n=1 Tax=Sulfuriferula sp. TaxID=2025307 RepID=UPI002730F932|nr:alpha-E domain-containing protein [Sulfuriferula sp.]MDP2025052.1 alpha-E domain-containing protein [Sulfuriferula sp.]
MLSRTADHLFWMARYIERAENTARVLDVAHRSALLPDDSEGAEAHLWYAPLNICGSAEAYQAKHGMAEALAVTRFMALDPDNPASIYTSLMLARENARAVRGAITSEMWESINGTWLDLNRMMPTLNPMRLEGFFDWVKERSHLFRGVTLGTTLKDDALHFNRLGTFLERADNTARILDVKYHILLPSVKDVGGAADYYQWGALLRSVSAFEAYRKIYRDVISPLRVAELLILRADMPRSLHACLNEVDSTLEIINGSSGHEARRLAGELHASLHFTRIEDVFRHGLHEYLTTFLGNTLALSTEIRSAYMAHRDEFTSSIKSPRLALQVQ